MPEKKEIKDKIRKMYEQVYNRIKNRDKVIPSCCVCGKFINIGDEYFFHRKHFKPNHLYCLDCAIEKNLLVR